MLESLALVNEIISLGVQLINVRIKRHSKNPIFDLYLFYQLRRIIKEEKPDVVLTYNAKLNVYGGLACNISRIPYITNITGVGTVLINAGLTRKILKILYRVGISEASCVMFQNEWNRKFFTHSGLIRPKTRTYTLPGSGVNLEKFSYQPYPEIEVPIVFSIIRRIMKDKGTDELLAAVRIVKEKFPDIRFRMIGYFDGDYKSIVEKAVEKGVIEYVEEQEDIRPYIKDSCAVIQPSHHEGMSNVLLESAATGRPVIATDIPGCREAFDNGISGLAFPIGEPKALAEVIMQFINLPYEDKVAMGRAGRKKKNGTRV